MASVYWQSPTTETHKLIWTFPAPPLRDGSAEFTADHTGWDQWTPTRCRQSV